MFCLLFGNKRDLVKILHWTYLTLSKLNKISRSYSEIRWEFCMQKDTFMHMWWNCPFLQGFSISVRKTICTITDLTLSPFLSWGNSHTSNHGLLQICMNPPHLGSYQHDSQRLETGNLAKQGRMVKGYMAHAIFNMEKVPALLNDKYGDLYAPGCHCTAI